MNYFGANPHLPKGYNREDEKNAAEEERKRKRESQRDISVNTVLDEMRENRGSARIDLGNIPRSAWVEVDLDAIAHNVRIGKKQLGARRHLMAVVKADAYGHGSVPVAKVALRCGADALAVATVEEGVKLRQAGIIAPILMLSEPPLRAIPYLLEFNIVPSVCTSEFALALGEEADMQGKVARYHLAIDTGMNRIGVHYTDVVEFIRSIDFHRGLKLGGVFTHFATADTSDEWDFKSALSHFNDAVNSLRMAGIDPGIVHCANSASIERYPDAYFDMGRMGITMYGLAPSGYMEQFGEDLIPAMSVHAQISYIKEPALGSGVSYGYTYRVNKPVQIATVPIGYADGLRRALSNRMKVIINGRLCNQAGNICMDQMMVEVPLGHSITGLAGGANIGDEVTIIGTQGDYTITADTMAAELGTINYEVTCGFGMRLPKIYTGKGSWGF